jgi:hypothetical protein
MEYIKLMIVLNNYNLQIIAFTNLLQVIFLHTVFLTFEIIYFLIFYKNLPLPEFRHTGLYPFQPICKSSPPYI